MQGLLGAKTSWVVLARMSNKDTIITVISAALLDLIIGLAAGSFALSIIDQDSVS
jgi:hypothetical protein